ncbi:hypothetical protein QTP88_020452 [Uroleucon formosanum]
MKLSCIPILSQIYENKRKQVQVKIFQLLDPVTKSLQSPDIDLLEALNNIQVVLDNIKKIRSDKIFQNSRLDPKQEYKVNTYFMIIDADFVSIETRFHSTGKHLLQDISLFSTAHLKQTKKRSYNIIFEFEDAIGFQQTYIYGEKYTSNNDSEHESEKFRFGSG